MKPKITKTIEFLKKFEGANRCPMELIREATGRFKLSTADVKKVLEIY